MRTPTFGLRPQGEFISRAECVGGPDSIAQYLGRLLEIEFPQVHRNER